MSRTVLSIMSDIDRHWFADHPGAQCYVRPLVPGELPYEVTGGHVLIVHVANGIRVRVPFRAFTEDDEPLRELVALESQERWLIRPSGEAIPANGTKRPLWEFLASPEAQKLIRVGALMDGGRQ